MECPDPQKLVDDLLQLRASYTLEKNRKRKGQRQEHPRASDIGDCPRKIFYDVTESALRPPHEVELLQRFERGMDIETLAVRELLGCGWKVIGEQVEFEIKELCPPKPSADLTQTMQLDRIIICTGHIDGRIRWDGLQPVFDVKSINPNVWNRIEKAQDFQRMGSFWSKYPRQLLLYMYQYEEPLGIFILDDCLGHWKIIPMVLEKWLDECEKALQIARTAAIGIHRNQPPSYCKDRAVCQSCWCRNVGLCTPPVELNEGIQIIEDTELAEKIARLAEIEEQRREYEALDKQVRASMKARGPGEYLADDWLITVTTIPRKAYTMTHEAGESIRTKWRRMPALEPVARDENGTPMVEAKNET